MTMISMIAVYVHIVRLKQLFYGKLTGIHEIMRNITK